MDQKFKVKYNGFVYIDQPAGGIPDRSSIEKAAKLLRKRKKTAQSIHPLFARGLDTRLDLEVRGNQKERKKKGHLAFSKYHCSH